MSSKDISSTTNKITKNNNNNCMNSIVIVSNTNSNSSKNIIKYGDDDLTSEIRKEYNDEYENIFIRNLLHLESNSTINDSSNISITISNSNNNSRTNNSNDTEDIYYNILNSDADNSDDFKGGLLSDRSSSEPQSVDTVDDGSKSFLSYITLNPSDSSLGFQNTFKILEKQINFNKTNKQQQTKSSLSPVKSLHQCFLRSISEEEDSNIDKDTEKLSDADQSLTFFELELAARQRLKELIGSSKYFPSDFPSSSGGEEYSEKIKLLENIPRTSTDDDDIIKNVGEYPEYLYHVAREKDGRLYLKVVRSLLIDKVLCGNRVSQMTRTYDDIEAVTRLLEEKEKDLELTVQIGKELLVQNTRLENRVTELEGDVKLANENLSQLSHDLHTKSTLLAALTNDDDGGSEGGTPVSTKSFNLDILQKKIAALENENKNLRAEATQLVKETDEVEEAEQRLMAEIRSQLNNTSYQYDGLCLELERVREENKLQHEQIINLTAKLNDAQIRLHHLTTENEEQVSKLSITEENQNLLATELLEFKARYQEVLALLQEAQEQLRKQRKRGQPSVRSNLIPGFIGASTGFGSSGVGGGGGGGGIGGSGFLQIDSLQSELMETSLFSDNSLDSGIASDRGGGIGGIGGGSAIGGSSTSNIPGYKKVFDTVRCATKNGHYSDGSIYSSNLSGVGGTSSSLSSMSQQPKMSFISGGNYYRGSTTGGSSIYSSSTYPMTNMGNRSYSRESLTSDSDESYPSKAPTGVPGVPGAKDLEAALKRLTPAHVLARRSMLSNAPPGTYTYSDDGQPQQIPFGIRTPDSIMSTGSSSGLSGISNHWRLPDKLQIVKPMEGSQTLHHWNRLATPTLSGLLDERPGVTIRGGRGLDDLGLQTYSLSDVEEDAEDLPGKQYQTYGSVYTYTNSTVMHPDDGTSVTSSVPQSQMSSQINSISSSRQPSAPSTPRHGLSRRNSCSTFSVNSGLASMLNERGIKAVTPSALNTPAGPNWSPTVTPCNSPEGSPPRSHSPEPPFLTGFLSSGADLLRRKIVGDGERTSRLMARNKILLSRQEKRALRSLRLMEKVESIGLENIIQPHPSTSVGISPLAMHGGGASTLDGPRTRSASPMAQLTSLKHLPHSNSSNVIDDYYAMDKELITNVLNKGFSSHDNLKDINNSSDNSNSNNNSFGNNSNNSNNNMNSNRLDNSNLNNLPTSSHEVDNIPGQSGANSARIKQMQRQKSRRNVINGSGGNNNGGQQRPDLGTVGGIGGRFSNNNNNRIRPDLGKVSSSPSQTATPSRTTIKTQKSTNKSFDDKLTIQQQQAPPPPQQQSMTQSFVGTISSLLFGRKGGLL